MFSKLNAARELFTMWPKILKSKTMIVNIAMLVVAVCSSMMELDFIKDNPDIMAFIATTLLPTANIILRFFTKEPVSAKTGLFK